MNGTWEEFIEFADNLLGRLEDLSEQCDNAEDYVEGVSERINKMREWAESHGGVNQSMWNSLSRYEDGLIRWEERL